MWVRGFWGASIWDVATSQVNDGAVLALGPPPVLEPNGIYFFPPALPGFYIDPVGVWGPPVVSGGLCAPWRRPPLGLLSCWGAWEAPLLGGLPGVLKVPLGLWDAWDGHPFAGSCGLVG